MSSEPSRMYESLRFAIFISEKSRIATFLSFRLQTAVILTVMNGTSSTSFLLISQDSFLSELGTSLARLVVQSRPRIMLNPKEAAQVGSVLSKNQVSLRPGFWSLMHGLAETSNEIWT